MKLKNNAGPAGFLFLLLLREGHTRSPRRNVQKLLIEPWEAKSWSKKIAHLNKVTAADNCLVSS
jgi:hypothetical protein